MGLDLFIEVRITEKKTGRLISRNKYDDYYSDVREKGFIRICWWGFSCLRQLGYDIVDICEKYTKTKVEYPKECVPIPHSALHEIYGCILKRAYLYDEDLQMVLPEMDWKENVWIERDSLENAKALHEWLRFINGMTDGFQIKDEDVPDEEDRKDLLKSPKNYEYEFRIDQA